MLRKVLKTNYWRELRGTALWGGGWGGGLSDIMGVIRELGRKKGVSSGSRRGG